MDCTPARTKDPRQWLESRPEFSAAMAAQFHDWILTWEPDLTESIKWNMLCYSGRKLVCGLSACQRHLSISFFRGTELPDPSGLFEPAENNTRILSVRLTTLDGFPRDAFRRLLHAAVALDADPTIPPLANQARKPWPVPDFFAAELAKTQNRAAAEGFARLAPSCQREFLVWLTTAKRPETRQRRLTETLDALTHGRKWAQRKGLPTR